MATTIPLSFDFGFPVEGRTLVSGIGEHDCVEIGIGSRTAE